MKWRAAGRNFVVPRGMVAESPREESSAGRCGRTIEAKPFSGQTCLIEPPRGSAGDNEEEEHGDSSTVRSHLFKRLIGETAPDARSFAANISVWSSAEAPLAWIHTRYIVAARIVLPKRIHAQETKPFTAEIKPSRKPKFGPQKTSIWASWTCEEIKTADEDRAGGGVGHRRWRHQS